MSTSDTGLNGLPFRIAYCLALVLVALPRIGEVVYGANLLGAVSENPNIVNPVFGVLGIAISIALGAVLLYRAWLVGRGYVQLGPLVVGSFLSWTQRISVVVLLASILLWLVSIAGLIITRIGAVSLISSSFKAFIPLSLATFELCRLIAVDHRIHSEDET